MFNKEIYNLNHLFEDSDEVREEMEKCRVGKGILYPRFAF